MQNEKKAKINIVGAGLAGLSAAIKLAEKGVASNLISYQDSERAQSNLAEGGINTALDTMGENDSTDEHFEDTIKGGCYLADPDAIRGLVETSPQIVKHLVDIGVPFQMDEGRLILRNFGGQKKKRTAYAKSSTGKAIMNAMIDEVRKYEASGLIKRYPHHLVFDINIYDGELLFANGIYIKDIYNNEITFLEGITILACGGMNGMFKGLTTGTVNNTGLLAARAFCRGVEFANLEFIQYHPTTVSIPGKRMLISEAARGEGGRLFTYRNGKPWYFMEEKYPELKNLMPRDVVSREIYNIQKSNDCSGDVYLDLRGILKEIWDEKLSDMKDEIIDYLGVNPMHEPVKVDPGIHFFMGGIRVDKNHKTNVKNLYAAGECACQYHGANRLGGNSMLAAIYGGSVAACDILSRINENDNSNLSDACDILNSDDLSKNNKYEECGCVKDGFSDKLTSILSKSLGIIRDEKEIEAALKQIDKLTQNDALLQSEKDISILAKAMLVSAHKRKESRGAHSRCDYPDTNDEYKKTSVVIFEDEKINYLLEDVTYPGGAIWK